MTIEPTNQSCIQSIYDFHNQGASRLGGPDCCIVKILTIESDNSAIVKILKLAAIFFTTTINLIAMLFCCCKSSQEREVVVLPSTPDPVVSVPSSPVSKIPEDIDSADTSSDEIGDSSDSEPTLCVLNEDGSESPLQRVNSESSESESEEESTKVSSPVVTETEVPVIEIPSCNLTPVTNGFVPQEPELEEPRKPSRPGSSLLVVAKKSKRTVSSCIPLEEFLKNGAASILPRFLGDFRFASGEVQNVLERLTRLNNGSISLGVVNNEGKVIPLPRGSDLSEYVMPFLSSGATLTGRVGVGGVAALTVLQGAIGLLAASAAIPTVTTTAGSLVLLGHVVSAFAQYTLGVGTLQSLWNGESVGASLLNGISAAVTAPLSILGSLLPSSEKQLLLTSENQALKPNEPEEVD